MAARCWGCEMQVVRVGTLPGRDPLGACWECHVFGCPGHARRDPGAGKFLCYPSVATALAASAGVDEADERLQFRSTNDFERRFPELAEDSRRHRRYFRRADQMQWMRKVEAGAPRKTDLELLGDALGVGKFLVSEVPLPLRHHLIDQRERSAPHAILSGRLADLVKDAPDP